MALSFLFKQVYSGELIKQDLKNVREEHNKDNSVRQNNHMDAKYFY